MEEKQSGVQGGLGTQGSMCPLSLVAVSAGVWGRGAGCPHGRGRRAVAAGRL